MSGLFRKKKGQLSKEDLQQQEKKATLTQSEGSESPRPFLLTSGCHGARNPLDWEAMPTSLQHKFPHWKESSVPSPLLPQRDSDRVKQRIDASSKTSNGALVPDNCIPYIVMANDSLVSIALKFDTTATEIAKVNKMPLLGKHPVYPGELLFVPDSEHPSNAPPTSSSSDKQSDVEVTDTPTPIAPPIEEDNLPLTDNLDKDEFITKGRSSSLVEMHDEVTDDHIYVSSKFMSEQLCVHGDLMVNKQSIMFKPNEEDPLVEDHGSDPYEVWLPLQEVVYAYMTREYSNPSSHTSSLQSPTPLATATPIKKDHTHPNIDDDKFQNDLNRNIETVPELQNEELDESPHRIESQNENESSAVGNNSESDFVQPMVNQNEAEVRNQPEPKDENEHRNEAINENDAKEEAENKKESKIESNHESETETENENESKNEAETCGNIEPSIGFVPDLSHGATTEGSTSSDNSPLVGGVDRTEPECVLDNHHTPENRAEPCDQNKIESLDCNGNRNESVESGNKERENRKNRNQSENESGLKMGAPPIYERRDTLGSLFQESFEKSLSDSGEDVLPAAPSPWYFLYCRLSQSSQQTNVFNVIGMKIPMGPFGKKNTVQIVRTWFIFAIPKKRVDDIYHFLCTHHPKLQQNDPDNPPPSLAEPRMVNNRLEIINLKGNYSDDSLPMSESHFLEPASSWEIFSVKDIQPPHIERMNVEDKLPLPLLMEPSNVLSDTHLRKLMPHLISGAVGHDWCPIYSTYTHGFSLHTLYRNMMSFEDSPVLLVVQDSYGKLFGAMVPCPLRVSDRFYGTGESFLFTFDGDDVSVFHWIGENDYIIKGSPDSIAFGSGDGFFGLWLDENLYRGSSLSCVTYKNRPLATTEDYIIHGVEAWGFV